MFHVGGFIGRTFSALASGASMVIPSLMGARDRRIPRAYHAIRQTDLGRKGEPASASPIRECAPQ
jgi:fatty-acyl-CoA synthase